MKKRQALEASRGECGVRLLRLNNLKTVKI